MLLALIGKLFVAIIVLFAVMSGLNKWWIKDTGFAEGGSKMLWTSIAAAFVAAIITLFIL